MTFKAIVRCDAEGCCQEVELECWDAADAEEAVIKLDESTEWFVDYGACDHYCPKHAKSAKDSYEESNPKPTGIYQTLVG